MTEDELNALVGKIERQAGRCAFVFQQMKNKIVWNVLGALRLQLFGEELGLIDENKYNFGAG